MATALSVAESTPAERMLPWPWNIAAAIIANNSRGWVFLIEAIGTPRPDAGHAGASLPGRATATKVGQRHGKPVVLVVRASEMVAAGHNFYLSANGVWLADRVPVEFREFF